MTGYRSRRSRALLSVLVFHIERQLQRTKEAGFACPETAPMKTTVQPASSRASMGNENTLKVGYFGQNCSSGRYITLAKERLVASWDDNLPRFTVADEAGMDFSASDRPLERLRRRDGLRGQSFETITWATGLLAATKRINVFGTVHVPLFHPVIAAKQMVTADQVGHGRFGLNIVAGWNEDELACSASRRKTTPAGTSRRRNGSTPSSRSGRRTTSISTASSIISEVSASNRSLTATRIR